ncbi:hypothetical protein PENPOL_c003G07881 [Penicillium polonicum]|uniref:Fumarylacetoacetase-like C-terminal domain-containing protein n=1 Tax=Penicillium polonicum TaxID=60169 RepID=A0A1V6NS02_PENPO|nr:hypothetical protein PENPOL_c003G07881 [Penicillium polonicum]
MRNMSKKAAAPHPHSHSSSSSQIPQSTTTAHPQIAQDSQADYKGKLCLVIGRDARNISPENTLCYVAAYTVGNDISARKLQHDPALAGRVPQWGFSKGFDTFAPLGPCLVAASEIADPSKLLLKMIVDGEVRQEEYVADLLFVCVFGVVSFAGDDVAEGECDYDGDAWC